METPTFEFDATTSSEVNFGVIGTLVDYENGVLDSSGSWNFNFSRHDPETIVSDPNGQAVVVLVGDEYKWNNLLDGITLWMVHEDAEDGWFGATVLQYEGGIQKGSIGLTDQVDYTEGLPGSVLYVKDESCSESPLHN